ncbi:glycosyltransferase family 4 protein [Rheinheimera sp. 1928-s]|uniref:glycosyltransferase family 4 protein n=1 Tax=Rheinheimera sp. 1928-s TaxID=3033803 RepID=UPI00262F135F|nr:glycosyltransferase family 4 protein [Rheinheimera sp. 1928-s]MDF3125755.1 glycosyltransferase family 4 protein [Rheinheimera sp. 1928-s]
MKKLLFLVNVDWFFISHRLPIAIEAKKLGYDVHIACNFTEHYELLASYGFKLHNIPFDRSGGGIRHELKTLLRIREVFSIVKPDVVHAVTIKPVLYGGLVGRILGIKNMVYAVSGLGLVFVAEGFVARIRRFLVTGLYKFALGVRSFRVIFQNPVDKNVLKQAIGLKDCDCVMIKGSGADLTTYNIAAEPDGTPIVVMAARLLREKGVYQFVDAARLLKARDIMADFQLVGEPDPGNPNTVTAAELGVWRAEGIIKTLGFRSDIPEVFAASHIVVLPSFYGEGLPKVLIEAAACGRAIVTTNNPGCAEAVIDGVNGLIVPAKDSKALADAIEMLVKDKDLRVRMGTAGRKLAEEEFDVQSVVAKHLDIYQELLKNAQND